MTDLTWRIIIVGGVALVALISIWLSSRRRPATSTLSRPDLGPGVHLFSSATCASCVDARRVLHDVYGDRFSEIRYEDDPARFGTFEISTVPTVFVLGPDGAGSRWEGVPKRRQLESALWVLGASKPNP